MKTLYFIASVLILSLRIQLSWLLLTSGTGAGVVLGLGGMLANITTIWAWCVGVPDLSLSGLGVALAHLLPLAFKPEVAHSIYWLPCFWCLFAVQQSLRFRLGRCCTVTAPVFVCVVRQFPYSVVRHPLTLVELCMWTAFALEFGNARNWIVFGCVVVSKVLLVRWEEKFLLQQEEYRRYAATVRWRWVPGVW